MIVNKRHNLYLIFILLTGCASSPPMHYYLLDSGNANQAAISSDSQDKVIGIGPVRFPDYLDRPQIVSRSSANELVLSDTHRWAEPLEENFTRILAEHISRTLGTPSVTIEPSRNRTKLDLRISIEVVQFDSDANGDIHLVSYWRAENPDGSLQVPQQRSHIQVSGYTTDNYPAIVSAMSKATAQLAAEIAASIPD